MHDAFPPLNALRAFEASARLLSLTKAAAELHVTAGALSHQIRGLEDLLGIKLFDRNVRSIALTPAGKLLYPGLQTGFNQIRDAVSGLRKASDTRVLVISALSGFTSKWLAPRLHRFSTAYPDIDARVSSSIATANFAADGVDVAVRNLAIDAEPDRDLIVEKLIDLKFIPVCSPALMAARGPFNSAEDLRGVPLIHDATLANRAKTPDWPDWFRTAGVENIDVSRGLRFDSAEHALEATAEGAGVLLAYDLLAYDDLRTGRLVIPFDLSLCSGRAYHFVCPKSRLQHPNVQAFRTWIMKEVAALEPRGRANPSVVAIAADA